MVSEKKYQSLEQIKSELSQHTGSATLYEGYMKIFLTEGALDFAEKANAYWLVNDASVILKLKLSHEPFVAIKTTVHNKGAVVIYDDGDGNELFRQEYEYTDLPNGNFSLWACDSVLMLPSEY